MNCPICTRPIGKYGALSRTDNTTLVCDTCGQVQAINAWAKWAEANPGKQPDLKEVER